MELLASLNPEQRAAVTHGNGPVLIVAGAGTGKTTVVTQRLAWLIDQQRASPASILTLTFTDKAATELEERVDRLLPYGYLDLWVSTFHAFGERVLREHGHDIGLSRQFTVLSKAQQWVFLHERFDAFTFDVYAPTGSPTSLIRDLTTHFSRLKDEHITPDEYVRYAKKQLRATTKRSAAYDERRASLELANAFAVYERLLADAGRLDFGDLITKTLDLFHRRPHVLAQYQRQFTHVLVDEFQDTNWAQYELVKLLAKPQDNLTVVGDDDQSVYKFRGASVANILQFRRDFPTARQIALVQNYRSRQNILDLAYDFIQGNNPDRLEVQLRKRGRAGRQLTKQLVSTTPGKAAIQYLQAPTLRDEVRAVVRDILRLRERDPKLLWSEIAILVRSNAHADPFVEALRQAEIPHQFVAARGLYQRPEVLDLVSWLRMLDSYHESPALWRVLSMDVWGMPIRELVLLSDAAKRQHQTLYEAALRAETIRGLSSRTVRSLSRVLKLIHDHTELAAREPASVVLWRFVQETKLIDRATRAGRLREATNLVKFLDRAQSFAQVQPGSTVRDFVRELNLLLEVGEDPAPAELIAGPDELKVMTIHGAKGLEFRHVFVVNLVEGRFPASHRPDPLAVPDSLIREQLPSGDAHLQEERRLFYVALTRAKHGLTLTAAQDYGGARRRKPSRFLGELNRKYVQTTMLDAEQLALPLPAARRPRGTARSVKLALPTEYSYSSLQAFDVCPKKYRYAYVLRIPTIENAALSFGKSIHGTLEDFYRLVQEGKRPTLRTLLQLYERNWVSAWYRSAKHEHARKAAGRHALTAYYTRQRGRFAKPAFLEHRFTLKVAGHSVRGAIDRVDRDAQGRTTVIDYKSGRAPKRQADTDTFQLSLYALALRELKEPLPVEAVYEYLEDGVRIAFPITEDRVAKAHAKVATLIARIQQSDFAATPSKWTCGHCDFKEICEDRLS